MRSIAPLLVISLLIALLAPMLVLAQGSPQDDKIYDEVRRRLADDLDVRGAGLSVVVKNGDVIIEGRVRDERARQKAPQVVKKVKGVKAVENKLKLFSES